MKITYWWCIIFPNEPRPNSMWSILSLFARLVILGDHFAIFYAFNSQLRATFAGRFCDGNVHCLIAFNFCFIIRCSIFHFESIRCIRRPHKHIPLEEHYALSFSKTMNHILYGILTASPLPPIHYQSLMENFPKSSENISHRTLNIQWLVTIVTIEYYPNAFHVTYHTVHVEHWTPEVFRPFSSPFPHLQSAQISLQSTSTADTNVMYANWSAIRIYFETIILIRGAHCTSISIAS